MIIYDPEAKGGHKVVSTTKPQYNTNNEQQENVVTEHVPDPPASQEHRCAHINNKFCAALGIIQIVIGVLAIVMNIVIYSDRQYKWDYYISHGVWGGTYFIITGSLGTAAGLLNNSCLTFWFMAMSIVAASLFAPVLVAISSISLPINYESYDRGIAMEIGILVLGVLELVIGIISAFVCCQDMGGCKPSRAKMTTYFSNSVYPQNTQQQPVNNLPEYTKEPAVVTAHQPPPIYMIYEEPPPMYEE